MVEKADSREAVNERVAIFIDVDNVLILAQNSGLPFHLHLIIDRVRQQGTIMSSKAYADWTASLLKPVLGDFRANAIELVQLPTWHTGRENKNTADIQLAVDAMEMVFSPVRPHTIVIVGGDRDYVPLVQKLKRYGVYVLGIGVEAGVSSVLTEACNSYVYYDDIVPPAPEETTEPVSLPDPSEAYPLMRRAVEALNREGRTPTGASVHAMMKQLSPAFDLARYKTTLKELAQDAHKAGFVSVTEVPGSDFTLAAVASPNAPVMPAPVYAKREYDFSTPATITASYRTILQEHRIPLMPWRIRKEFIKLIWGDLAERGDRGMTFEEIRETLLDYSRANDMRVSEHMIRKLLYTLNFAHCFSFDRGAVSGRQVGIPDQVDFPLYPVVNVEDAIDKAHIKYLEVLAREAPDLYPDAVFDLLYEDEVADDGEADKRREVITKMCERVKPLSRMGQALLEARKAS